MNDCRLYVGTDDGVHSVDIVDGETTERRSGCPDQAVREIDVHPDNPNDVLVACGLRGSGVHRSRDGGSSWTTVGFDDAWAWGVTRDPADPSTVYVGTEPPMLHRSTDDGETFSAFDALDDLPSRDDWHFFYEPFEAGHLHGIAVDPADPDRVVVGIEVGGLVSTRDGGETWQDALVGFDVHDTTVVRGSDRIFVAAGEGLLVSDDGGETFEAVPGFTGDYAKQFLWVDDRLYVDANASSDGFDATIHVTSDGGESWEPVPNVPPANVVGDRLLAAHGDSLFHAYDRDGDRGDDSGCVVVATDDSGETWRALGPVHDAIHSIAAAELP